MYNAEDLNAARGGREAIAVRREALRGACLDLSDADLVGVDLSHADLRGADFTRAKMTNANLTGTDLNDANLRDADLSGARLKGTVLSLADLTGTNFSGARFSDVVARGVVANRVKMDRAELRDSDLRSADLTNASLRRAVLETVLLNEAALAGADFNGATLNKVSLQLANIEGANFINALLRRCDLTRTVTNTGTRFDTVTIKKCKIDRYSLECLGPNYGQLTIGQRMDLEIEDDVARLRQSYSGVAGWVHATALLIFLFPYAWFLGKNWVFAHLADSAGDGPALGTALLKFILSGGEHWQSPGWVVSFPLFSLFIFSLAYNALRGRLLWKTKSLELQEHASGLPARFSLAYTWEGWRTLQAWGFWYRAAMIGFWLNLAVLLRHTAHFLSIRVPV